MPILSILVGICISLSFPLRNIPGKVCAADTWNILKINKLRVQVLPTTCIEACCSARLMGQLPCCASHAKPRIADSNTRLEDAKPSSFDGSLPCNWRWMRNTSGPWSFGKKSLHPETEATSHNFEAGLVHCSYMSCSKMWDRSIQFNQNSKK